MDSFDLDPVWYIVTWTDMSQSPKRHLDRFPFCTALCSPVCPIDTQTSVAIGRIRLCTACRRRGLKYNILQARWHCFIVNGAVFVCGKIYEVSPRRQRVSWYGPLDCWLTCVQTFPNVWPIAMQTVSVRQRERNVAWVSHRFVPMRQLLPAFNWIQSWFYHLQSCSSPRSRWLRSASWQSQCDRRSPAHVGSSDKLQDIKGVPQLNIPHLSHLLIQPLICVAMWT